MDPVRFVKRGLRMLILLAVGRLYTSSLLSRLCKQYGLWDVIFRGDKRRCRNDFHGFWYNVFFCGDWSLDNFITHQDQFWNNFVNWIVANCLADLFWTSPRKFRGIRF